MCRHRTAVLFLILAGALAVRLVLALSASESSLLSIDGGDYRDISENLVRGDGFSISYYRWFEPVPPDHPALHADLCRPPLLPFLGAACAWFPGSWLLAVRLTAAVLGTLAVLVVYGVGTALFGKTSGTVAALFMAVYPYSLYYSSRWSTESLALVLLWAGVWFWVRSRTKSTGAMVLVGAALGLAGLARPNMLLIAAAVVLLALVRLGPKRSLAMVAAMVIVLAPWAIRNASVAGVPTPATFFGPYDMWLGMNDAMYEMYRHPFSKEFNLQVDRAYELSDRHVAALEAAGRFSIDDANRYWISESFRFLREHPDRAAFILASRALHYFQPVPTPAAASRTEVAVSALSVLPLMFLSLVSLSWDVRSRRRILSAVLAAGFLGSLPFIFCLRFRYPVLDPLLIILGAHGMVMVVRRAFRSGRRAAAVA